MRRSGWYEVRIPAPIRFRFSGDGQIHLPVYDDPPLIPVRVFGYGLLLVDLQEQDLVFDSLQYPGIHIIEWNYGLRQSPYEFRELR